LLDSAFLSCFQETFQVMNASNVSFAAAHVEAEVDVDNRLQPMTFLEPSHIHWPPIPSSTQKRSPEWLKYNAALRDQDWLVQELVDEVDSAKPSDGDMDVDQNYNQVRLTEEFCKIFYKGRMFCNCYQLFQMVKRFGSNWGFDVTADSIIIKCCFAKPAAKKADTVTDRKRKRETSRKETIKCPFYLKLSDKGRKRKNSEHRSKRRVAVSEVHAHHTCTPGIKSQQLAKQKNGTLLPSMKELSGIVQVLQTTQLTNTQLRAVLKKFMPADYKMDHIWLRNFRTRAGRYNPAEQGPQTLRSLTTTRRLIYARESESGGGANLAAAPASVVQGPPTEATTVSAHERDFEADDTQPFLNAAADADDDDICGGDGVSDDELFEHINGHVDDMDHAGPTNELGAHNISDGELRSLFDHALNAAGTDQTKRRVLSEVLRRLTDIVNSHN
jgi:hypothetical protein